MQLKVEKVKYGSIPCYVVYPIRETGKTVIWKEVSFKNTYLGMGEYESIGSSVGNVYTGSIFPPFFLFFFK